VYWLGKPALVRESEIQTIQRFLNDHPSVEVETLTELLPNQPITIVSGLFMGQEGIVQNVSGNKVQVHIVSLGVILKATLPREAVQLK
jgi:transcription antitermination factor NusG